MSEQLHQELRVLAEQVAAIEDEYVIDFGGCIARIYKRERFAVLGLIAVDSMVQGGPELVDEGDLRLMAVRERMRDRLRGLLAWARQTGRAQ